MCMFIYLFVVYFSFAPVITAITHLYCELFYIQVLTMVIITETLTSTSHHDIFTYLDYIFSCYLHIYIYMCVYVCVCVCVFIISSSANNGMIKIPAVVVIVVSWLVILSFLDTYWLILFIFINWSTHSIIHLFIDPFTHYFLFCSHFFFVSYVTEFLLHLSSLGILWLEA